MEALLSAADQPCLSPYGEKAAHANTAKYPMVASPAD